MDTKLKQTALRNLARTAGEAAEKALRGETKRIRETLQNETQYDAIVDQLELLGAIAFRVHAEVVEIVKTLLLKLEHLNLTYQEIEGFPSERVREYHNNDTLVVKCLEVLERIRYHEIDAVFEIFFEQSISPKLNIKKQAMHGLEVLAAYELDIFYGDGKEWGGLAWQPQEKVLAKLVAFNDQQKVQYFSGILSVSEKLLSPTIKGTEWNYRTVTMSTGVIPANKEIKNIRNNTLRMLTSLYALAPDIEQKKAVLHAMSHATRAPSMNDYDDETLKMIMQDTVTVLLFMIELVRNEDLQIKQQLEHDAYFFYRRSADEEVKANALAIRDVLDGDKEYQIFKVLIGFQGVFRNWSDEDITHDDFEKERNVRESQAAHFAASINERNFAEWSSRILAYSKVRSNDLATFPHFGKFLEQFGRLNPALAILFLQHVPDHFEGFVNAVLLGVADTKRKLEAYDLIAKWCDQGKFLFSLARFFEFSKELDEGLLEQIFEKARSDEDLITINQIITSIAAHFTTEKRHLIGKFFLPGLEILTTKKDYNWIFGFWFRKQGAEIIACMEINERQKILDNLKWLGEIDYHAEDILVKIAEVSPELVVRFFLDRIKVEEEGKIDKYDAIPFSFHELSVPLSKIPDLAVDLVLKTYDGNYGMFIYRGARLLKNIFPKFSIPFEKKLIEVIRANEIKSFMVVLAVLRNYEGEPFLHAVSKELIRVLPAEPSLLNEMRIMLLTTGVVSGAHGFVEAYERKRGEISPWLDDSSEVIRKFAQDYISVLENRIEFEKKRADDDLILRKHMYGVGKDEQ